MKYSLTIIIPTYNAIEHLENWEKILINEIFSYIEFIFVDSNSNDGTNEFLSLFSKRYKNVFVYKIKSSIYEAMNFGVFKSSSNWILFTGIDDYLLKPINHLIININNKKLNNYDLLIVDYQISKKNIIKEKKSIKQLNYPHHQSCIFNKQTLLNLNYIYNTKYLLYSDMDLIFRILKNKKILYLPYNCVNFSKGGKSTNGKYFKESLVELTTIAFKNNKIFTKFYLISVLRIIYYYIDYKFKLNKYIFLV